MIARTHTLAPTLLVSSIACSSSTPPASSPSSAEVEARVASADGVSIHYVAEGSGPAVVLVHCLGGNLHFLMLDKPTEFASTLRDVVESIESGKAKRRPN